MDSTVGEVVITPPIQDYNSTGRLEVDGKSVLILNESTSWSINRKTFDMTRKALDQSNEPINESLDLECPQDRGENPFSAIKSFDRIRDQKVDETSGEPEVREAPHAFDPKKTAILSLSALGVVYGDIGTSPLYTIQTMYASVPVDEANIVGGISALLWLLMLVVSFKYVTVVLRANNRGEGGVMALTALASQSTHQMSSAWWKGAILTLGDSLGCCQRRQPILISC